MRSVFVVVLCFFVLNVGHINVVKLLVGAKAAVDLPLNVSGRNEECVYWFCVSYVECVMDHINSLNVRRFIVDCVTVMIAILILSFSPFFRVEERPCLLPPRRAM